MVWAGRVLPLGLFKKKKLKNKKGARNTEMSNHNHSNPHEEKKTKAPLVNQASMQKTHQTFKSGARYAIQPCKVCAHTLYFFRSKVLWAMIYVMDVGVSLLYGYAPHIIYSYI